MLICSVRLPSLVLRAEDGWHGEDDAFRIPLTGRGTVAAARGDDLANLSPSGYWGASLYSVRFDHSTFFRNRPELVLDSVVAGEIRDCILGGVRRLWCCARFCLTAGLMGPEVPRLRASLGGVGGLVGKEASAWSAGRAESEAAMAASQPVRTLAEGSC